MANQTTFPSTDAGLLAWSLNWTTLTSQNPTPLGLTAALCLSYAALHAGYSVSLAAVDPGVRNKAAVSAKNASRLHRGATGE